MSTAFQASPFKDARMACLAGRYCTRAAKGLLNQFLRFHFLRSFGCGHQIAVSMSDLTMLLTHLSEMLFHFYDDEG